MNVSSLTIEQRRRIDLAKEKLVTAAEKLLDDAQVTPNREFGHSQLRNLVAVASETESPAVVLNFIRYQMGRDDKGKNWSRVVKEVPVGEPSREVKKIRLGDLFITDLEEQGGVVRQSLQNVPGCDDPVTGQLARMELIRYFLGFATRYMKYMELKSNQGNQGNHGNQGGQGARGAQERRGGGR